MDYAKALQDARERRGISKRQLAVRAGLDPSYIAHLESGRRKPSLDVLEKLASVLELPVPLLMLMSADETDLRGIDPHDAQTLSNHLLVLLTKVQR